MVSVLLVDFGSLLFRPEKGSHEGVRGVAGARGCWEVAQALRYRSDRGSARVGLRERNLHKANSRYRVRICRGKFFNRANIMFYFSLTPNCMRVCVHIEVVFLLLPFMFSST